MSEPIRKRKAILVDVDGTLAGHDGKRGNFDWNKVSGDFPHTDIIELVNMLANIIEDGVEPKYDIIIMSGRDEVCRFDTEAWLNKHNVIRHELLMRPQGDYRKDAIVKRELYEKYVKPYYDVHMVIDDRQQVVDMWRNELGFRVLQVAEGKF